MTSVVLDIEQMVKRELRDSERVCELSREWHSTEWPRIRQQQTILEICEVPKTINFWYICS